MVQAADSFFCRVVRRDRKGNLEELALMNLVQCRRVFTIENDMMLGEISLIETRWEARVKGW